MKSLLIIGLTVALGTSVTFAAETPTPTPTPTETPDLADQVVRIDAAARILYRDKQNLEDRIIVLEQDKASLQSKLNAAATHSQALQKQIDDAKPKSTPETAPSPTETPK